MAQNNERIRSKRIQRIPGSQVSSSNIRRQTSPGVEISFSVDTDEGTMGFSQSVKIGKSTCGNVYRSNLDGTEVSIEICGGANSDEEEDEFFEVNTKNERPRPQRLGWTSGSRGPTVPSNGKQTSVYEMLKVKPFHSSNIKRATKDFHESLKIGKWRFGNAYKGNLDNTEVFIKTLYSRFDQDQDEFLRELKVLEKVRHPNLVELVGYCIELRTLVYELLPDKSLEYFLNSCPEVLTWQIRARIINQLCSALIFLYSNKPRPIFHGNIKASFIFLDVNLDIKVLIPGGTPSTNPNPRGKFTECIEIGNRSLDSDVHSLGITILQLLTGLSDSTFAGGMHHVGEFDITIEGWPFQLATDVANFVSKFCDNSTRQLMEVVADLTMLSAAINDHMDKEDKKDTSSTKCGAKSENYGTSSDNSDKTSSLSKEASRFKSFTYSEIQGATNGLSESSKIGQGAYGSVYNGYLDNTEVAIKILDAKSDQGAGEFVKELQALGDIRHPHLVRLIGACFKHYSLVYEFVPNGSLEDCLKERPKVLTWRTRTRIIFELCSVLMFLHSQEPQRMVHKDVKPQNILLDANYSVKLADFGLCRYLPEGSTSATAAVHVTKNIQGTEWYMDPDHLEFGKLSPGCDVYAFGVTILRILTGAPAADIRWKVERACHRKKLMTIVDFTAGDWPEQVAEYLARVGLECCEQERKCSTLMEEISSGLNDILVKNFI